MQENEVNYKEPGAVKLARETKERASLGKPGKYFRFQKILIYILAILAAGVIELIIILLFSQLG